MLKSLIINILELTWMEAVNKGYEHQILQCQEKYKYLLLDLEH